MVVEFTIVNFGMWFDIKFRFIIFEVIAAIGFGFVILNLLLSLSPRFIGIMGAFIFVLYGLVPFGPAPDSSAGIKLISVLLGPGVFPYGEGKLFFVAYPLVPWLGIMLVGLGAGQVFTHPVEVQRKALLRWALAVLSAFLVLRIFNAYGEPVRWVVQKSSLHTFLSFFNISKYPPSLLFCLLFLGIMLFILSLIQVVRKKFTEIIIVYGKVPLFYFMIHWYIIHPLVFLMIFLQGFNFEEMVFGANFGRPKIGSGVYLWAVYLVWVGVVLLMYPLCRWYGRYKAQHKVKWWLRYV